VRHDPERATERRDDARTPAAREPRRERVEDAGPGETTTISVVTRNAALT
jgi:hypothetical protein